VNKGRTNQRASALPQKYQSFLKNSPSPALAEANLSRLIESGSAKALAKVPRGDLAALFGVLGGSTYLSDILFRQGKGWPDLFLRQLRVKSKSVAVHLRALEPYIRNAGSIAEFCAGLRRHKQHEYLRIGARDLMPSVTMEETVRELTALAEASLDAAYRFCRAEVEKDYGDLNVPGSTQRNRMVVLGMGKLGGGELNFSSDIDVIFLYESDEGESVGGLKGKTTPREFFAAIGKKIIQAMGQVTEDGFVFRIDPSAPTARWYNPSAPPCSIMNRGDNAGSAPP
jgi:glutamate-ammonia-ligase adenylyltransferase